MDDSRPRPRPAHAEPPPTPRISRRWFVAGGSAVLLGAGAGVGAEFLRTDSPAAPPRPPTALVAAVAAERALIADLDATTGGAASVRRVLVQVRADHAAHLSALTGLVAQYRAVPRPASPAHGTPRTLAQLRSAEQWASAAAAAHASALAADSTTARTATTATLLASIAACEATHAELLQ